MEDRSIEYNLETIGDELLPKFLSNYYAGRKDSALQMAKRIAEVYDSALVRQKRSDAAELAVVYDTQGKERRIAEEQARNRLTVAISIAVGIVALLSIIFAVYVYRQWRASKEKNRILAQQITEAVEYKEKYRQCQHDKQNLTQSIAEKQKVESTVQENQNGRVTISISDYTTLNDEQLFLCLRDLIENEKLFLQPDFGRQTLISHTGLSKEHIGAAFAQGSDRNSLPAYVRELRLDYAIRLMNDQPEMNIEQVSQASGFTSADTFTRNFRAKYGMTPTAYKQTKDGM
jgi:AraC-like DNA-binding protein